MAGKSKDDHDDTAGEADTPVPASSDDTAEGEQSGKYVLRLYVAGTTPNSLRAMNNIRKMCNKYLDASCDLEIIDIYQQPIFARNGQIVAAPTLVKELPPPLRRFIGDMSNLEKILLGLDVRVKDESNGEDDDDNEKH